MQCLLHCRRILYQLSQKGSPRILDWVADPFSRGSSWPRNWTRVFCIAGRFFTNWAIREACFNPNYIWNLSEVSCWLWLSSASHSLKPMKCSFSYKHRRESGFEGCIPFQKTLLWKHSVERQPSFRDVVKNPVVPCECYRWLWRLGSHSAFRTLGTGQWSLFFSGFFVRTNLLRG